MNNSPSKKIDAYVKKQPKWAQDICVRLRKAVRKADRKIAEAWKWSSPAFEREGIVCFFWATKKNVKLYFFRGADMADRRKIFDAGKKQRSRSVTFTDAKEVKESVIVAYVREAVKLNGGGAETKKRKPKPKRPVAIPKDLQIALEGVGAVEGFKSLPPYMQRDCVLWVEAAKRMDTRIKRIEELVEKVAYARRRR